MCNWELKRSKKADPFFQEEEDNYAVHLNVLIDEIAATSLPSGYYAFENQIAAECNGAIEGRYFLKGKLWCDKKSGQEIQKDDVGHMMEQASAALDGVRELVLVAAMRHGMTESDDLY